MPDPQPIPFLDLITPHRELEEELVSVFRDALRSAAVYRRRPGGSFRARVRGRIAGRKYCVGVANGTDAVRFALMAAGIGRR